MGNLTSTLISSPSTEKAFLTLVYNYMISLYDEITCDVIDDDGETVLGHDVDSFIWTSGKNCNMDFYLGDNFKIRFQSSPVTGQSHLRSSGYNVFFMHNDSIIMSRGSGSTRYYNSGCLSFGKQDVNGDVVSFEYPNDPRKLLFTKYVDDNVFIFWATPYDGDSFKESSTVSFMKFKDTNNNWRWVSHASPNSIENGYVYDSAFINSALKSPMFSFEARTGYLDFISHSSFVSGSTKAFTSTDIYDCTTVNFGDTLSLKDGANFLAIGAHSMVRLDEED